MRVLVCGSRNWTDEAIMEIVLEGAWEVSTMQNEEFVIIQGAANGADRLAGDWAAASKLTQEVYPADWNLHGKAAGPIRNQQMLDEAQPDLVVAFKDGFDWTMRRGGTEDMVRRAKKAGIPAYVVSRA